VSKDTAKFRMSTVLKRGIKALESTGKKLARVEINITIIPEDDLTATTNENQDLKDLV